MKYSLILQQHIPYADMVIRALELCETMLSQSHTLYPFAVFSQNQKNECVFTANLQQHAGHGLIEELQKCIGKKQATSPSYVSVLAYSATVCQADINSNDSIVLIISDSCGMNSVAIYPYAFAKGKLQFKQPYVCDFLD